MAKIECPKCNADNELNAIACWRCKREILAKERDEARERDLAERLLAGEDTKKTAELQRIEAAIMNMPL